MTWKVWSLRDGFRSPWGRIWVFLLEGHIGVSLANPQLPRKSTHSNGIGALELEHEDILTRRGQHRPATYMMSTIQLHILRKHHKASKLIIKSILQSSLLCSIRVMTSSKWSPG